MGYLAGLAPSVAAMLRVEARDPHIFCDGCGIKLYIKFPPPKWFLDGRGPPKWKMNRSEDTRKDYCPKCTSLYELTKTIPRK